MTRVPRMAFATAALAVLALAVPLPGQPLGPAPAAAQSELMRCMEQCIRQEGRGEKDTCKLRCANVPPAGAGAGGGRDCMSEHKDCQARCGRDKNCKRACRKRLLRCK